MSRRASAFCPVILITLTVQVLSSAPVTYSNPFASYGTVQNSSCGAFGGICAAAQAENSFIFLANQYPAVYGGTKLTTGNNSGPAAQNSAATDFGVNGWTANGNNYAGYYNRFSAGYPNNQGINGNYINTKNDWFNSFAPGTSTITSYTQGTQGIQLLSTFFGPELADHEDVELFIYLPDMSSGHVISPLSITYDPMNMNGCPLCSFTYQDPNNPTVVQMADLTTNANGYLQFFDSSTFNANVIITAAFAESPVPEPGTLAMFIIAVGASIVLQRKLRGMQHPR
jgi:hypothetical protein